MIVDYEALIKKFNKKFDHYQAKKIGVIPPEVIELRRKLILEEAYEFDTAAHNGDIEKVADSLADLLYVVFGAALAYGVPIGECFIEVHRSNMTKSMQKDEKSVKGKTLKGDDYTPPDLKKILLEQEKRENKSRR
jgi:predicted HAD superfamily Cof-like phosphohydrolase